MARCSLYGVAKNCTAVLFYAETLCKPKSPGAKEDEERMSENAELLLRIFRAVEQRDPEIFGMYHPDVEFHEAPSLPFGGTYRGMDAVLRHADLWRKTWDPLQTEAERRTDARIVADANDEVVALWRQKAVTPTGQRLDSPVLAFYRIRDNKLARAQMFHFDTAAVVNFLRSATLEVAVPAR
jgi:ketosteroid isomerase-like protein